MFSDDTTLQCYGGVVTWALPHPLHSTTCTPQGGGKVLEDEIQASTAV